MGFVTKYIRRPGAPQLNRLPSGSFTVDGEGRVLSSTVPQSFSQSLLKEIGQQVVAIFKGAHLAQVPFSELVVNYDAYKITARELRGGAMIFLAPKTYKTNA